jgi:hypothetical protein
MGGVMYPFPAIRWSLRPALATLLFLSLPLGFLLVASVGVLKLIIELMGRRSALSPSRLRTSKLVVHPRGMVE